MMKVVGEEGTPIADFVVYLKSEFIDSVYLQQNTFDPVDSGCGAERQNVVFDKLIEVLKKEFTFPDKNQARVFFQKLRQEFIDWNYSPWKSEAFDTALGRIDALLNEAR